MFRKLIIIFIVFSQVSCVTVTELETKNVIDSDKVVQARVQLGARYLQAGYMNKARENLDIALQYAPNDSHALMVMAYYYQQVGELEQAEITYQKALYYAPNDGDVLNNYGAFLCHQGDYSTAIHYFEQAVHQTDYYRISDSYENAAKCALNDRNQHKAREYFIKSLEHEPNRLRSLLSLTQLEIDMGDLISAQNRLLTFHQRYGYKESSLKLLIKLEKQLNNPIMVIKYITALETRFPESIENKDYKTNEQRTEQQY